MSKQLALALLLATVSTTCAAAEGLSHNYVEIGFVRHQIERPLGGHPDFLAEDPKIDGGYIAGSVALGESFYLLGGYQKGDDVVRTGLFSFHSDFDVDVDAEQGHLGFGYRHTLSERVEWTGELSYVNTRIKTELRGYRSSGKGDDYRASLGLRGNLASHFEGWAKANYTDGDFYDGEFSGTLGALVKFNQTWGIVGEAEVGSDDRQFRLGVRASF